MKDRVEILAPAGSMECLKAAIAAGADAVYTGGALFGARAYAHNLTEEELLEAIDYVHLHGRRLYLTVNTLIKDREMEKQMYDYLLPYYRQGLDAVIVQDIGLFRFIRKHFPDLPIHASTQMTLTGVDGAKFLEKEGAQRIVTSRELSMAEVKKIADETELEIESFVHGALCYCYSGQCLFSSFIGGRSGNRGQCAQPCRLPYQIDGKKPADLMSLKDLCTIDILPELIDAGVDSFKIEGRMKSPSYVGYVTRLYRKLIDNHTNKVTSEEENNLKILFNRDFTSGYLFNDKVMNTSTSNHQGLEIGRVLEVTPKKIKIKLTNNLYQEDGIRFKNSNLGMIANFIYNEKDLLINTANKGDIIYLDNKINLKEKDILIKTSSGHLDEEILSTSEKKIIITIDVLQINDYLEITFKDNNGNKVSDRVKTEVPQKRPTTNEEIKEKLTKLGNTPFICSKINININKDIFVNMKDLNNIRRLLINNLTEARTSIKRDLIVNEYPLDYNEETNYYTEISVLARNKDQVEASLAMNVDRIYLDSDLYEEYKGNSKVYLRLERVNSTYPCTTSNILATELGAINKYKNNNLISDYYLNVVNNYSIKFLLDNGVKRVTLSPEINYNYLDDYIKDKVEIIIYGTIENMLTKSCPIKELKMCPCKKEDIYFLEDINKNRYRILHNNCLTHIMHYKKINYIDNIEYYKNIGIRSFRLELLDETYDEVIKLINEIKK